MIEKDFIQMWQADGIELYEMDVREVGEFYYKLLTIHMPWSSVEYGRHGAILLKISKNDRTIIAHDTHNIIGGTPNDPVKNVTQETQDWFEKHVGI